MHNGVAMSQFYYVLLLPLCHCCFPSKFFKFADKHWHQHQINIIKTRISYCWSSVDIMFIVFDRDISLVLRTQLHMILASPSGYRLSPCSTSRGHSYRKSVIYTSIQHPIPYPLWNILQQSYLCGNIFVWPKFTK